MGVCVVVGRGGLRGGSRWVCEVALGGGGGFWSISVVMGGCDYCFFIAKIIIIIINKNKIRNYVENTCQTNFLFSNLL